MRSLRSFLVAVLAFVLCGCVAVPLPHYTRSSPRLTGRVLDASGKPVGGAIVQVIVHKGQRRGTTYSEDLPGASADTDESGRFLVHTHYNFHLLWYANVSWDGHLPFGEYWSGEILITKDDHPFRLCVLNYWAGERSVAVGEVRLTDTEAQMVK